MDKDYGELIEYLDEKFQKTAKKEDLKELASKEDLKDLSSKLITLDEFDGFKKEVNERFDKLDKRIDRLVDSIDKLTKSIEIYHHEQTALGAKVDRLEQWINQIAKQTGIELKP